MTPGVILAILQGLLGAAPEILALFQQATAGTPVSATQVQSVLSQYGVDRAVFAAAIAQAEATAAPPPLSMPATRIPTA